MRFLDLRSDTVTQPTPPMREAIASAPVGDDVLGDDPTVRRLEERVAELAAKPAALFVPSGTMSNQLALRSQTRWGDQLICHRDAHIYHYEAGAPAALSGLQIAPVGDEDGSITRADVDAARHPDDIHYAPTVMLALENTHNRCGGRILGFEATCSLARWARETGLRVHLDGARLWNASIATGIPIADWAAAFDSVSLCLSKGLGAPVGSVLVSSAEVIQRARRVRKQWGGGMRQAGLLAAAGLYALDHHVDRLAEDHRRAARIAAELDHPELRSRRQPETNIVLFEVISDRDAPTLVGELAAIGVGASVFGPRRVRFVTHLGIDDADCDELLERLHRHGREVGS
jgi:threonine aldolase